MDRSLASSIDSLTESASKAATWGLGSLEIETSTKLRMMVIILVCGIAGIIIIIVLVVCCRRKRNALKQTQDIVPTGHPVNQPLPQY